VELDRGLFDHLVATHSSVRLFNRDILTVDPVELYSESPGKITVISNLPYHISSEVVLWLIAHRTKVKRAVLLLQREVAERLAAAPGTRESGSLSLQVNLYAEATLGPIVSGRSFFPAADVESRVMQIRLRDEPLFKCDPGIFEDVARAAFGKRRKTILNSLLSSALTLTKAELEDALSKAGIDVNERAERLGLESFVKLANSVQPIVENRKLTAE
jgi:16S rRNA (adenine1518-N6/adenine1519-N6)-dimethyltransferase